MKVKLEDLEIDEIIIHPIRRWKLANGKDLPKQAPATSLSTTTTAELDFLQEKIADAGRHAQPIRPSQQQVKMGNLQPQRVVDLLKGKGDLVKDSAKMVGDLAVAQNKQTGHDYLLLVGTGTCKKVPVVIMFTMQGENGIQAIEEPGKPIELKEIKNLVLNKKARLDKMVAFELQGNHAVGVVEDSVMRGAAQYFLTDFLGFEATEKSWRHTQQFYKAVIATINSPTVMPEDKVALTDALHAELRAPSESIDIGAFKDKYVKAAYHPEFEKQLAYRDLKVETITKDTRLVKSDLEAVMYHLTSDITVRLGSATPKGAVKPMHDDKDGDYLKVKGKIKYIGKIRKASAAGKRKAEGK